MPGLPSLQPDYRAKLVKLLGMLGSDHDGERANAARLADEHRRKSGLTWHDFVLPLPEARPRKARKPRKRAKPRSRQSRHHRRQRGATRRKWLRSPDLATEWERTFAAGLLAKWCGPFTVKQEQCLKNFGSSAVEQMTENNTVNNSNICMTLILKGALAHRRVDFV